MKNTILIIGILLINFACGDKDKAMKHPDTVTKKGVLVESFEEYRENAATEITAVTLDKNILTIAVSYSGGCESHEFSLIGSKLITKSLPPQRGIMLFHNSNGDSCRELIEEELKFDIKDFEYKEQEEIILVLDGWKDKISFTSM